MNSSQLKSKLEQIKQQEWFYEFALPDGTQTKCYLPLDARRIHTTRESALRRYVDKFFVNANKPASALDVSCHEGYFSTVLAEHFDSVTGIDKNADSIAKAKLIVDVISPKGIQFRNSTLEDWPMSQGADFVLCFGLFYHVENPVEVMRRLAALTHKAICIETQVLPFQITTRVEDGSYLWQRQVKGIFGLCTDYAASKEGGRTDLALVPSIDGVISLLEIFGFQNILVYEPGPADYEQFVRGSRTIIYAEKA